MRSIADKTASLRCNTVCEKCLCEKAVANKLPHCQSVPFFNSQHNPLAPSLTFFFPLPPAVNSPLMWLRQFYPRRRSRSPTGTASAVWEPRFALRPQTWWWRESEMEREHCYLVSRDLVWKCVHVCVNDKDIQKEKNTKWKHILFKPFAARLNERSI